MLSTKEYHVQHEHQIKLLELTINQVIVWSILFCFGARLKK